MTLGTLGIVARAESSLKMLGFRSLRVRHYGDLARVELALDEMGTAMVLRQEVVDAVRSAGYRYVTLDLEGLRSGNLNAALSTAQVASSLGQVTSGSSQPDLRTSQVAPSTPQVTPCTPQVTPCTPQVGLPAERADAVVVNDQEEVP